MKYILIILALGLSTSAQASNYFATKMDLNNPLKVIKLNKADVIDLTTKDGDRWHVEDIEDGLIKIPNVKVSNGSLLVTLQQGKLPVSVSEIMMASAMMKEGMIIEEGGGNMGGGGK